MGTRARVAWERVVSCACQVGRWVLPLVLFLIAGISTAAAQESASPSFYDYWGESRFLVDVPGASNSLGAGLLNPAAWSMRDRGGLYFAWEAWDEEAVARDWPAGTVDPRDWTAIASLKLATFAVRRYGIDSEG
ncbi:MAG: hypothetical protein V1774_04895, partial [Candidatus Eisenbacteria bacterium]